MPTTTLITGTVWPVLIYRNRPALSGSTVDQMWSSISTNICSNSSVNIRPHLCFIKTLARDANDLLQNVAHVFRHVVTDRCKTVGYTVAEGNRRSQYVAHTVIVNCRMVAIHCRIIHFFSLNICWFIKNETHMAHYIHYMLIMFTQNIIHVIFTMLTEI